MRGHPYSLTAARASRRLRFALGVLVASWLLAQAFGQVHAVLHVRLSALPGTTAGTDSRVGAVVIGSAAVASLGRAFHPQGDPARPDEGVCRLYAQLTQGDLAAGTAPVASTDGAFAAPPCPTVASADTARRRGLQARGPPRFG